MKKISFFKPNKSATGHAAFFSLNDRDFYLNMQKQTGWDSVKNNGIFKSDKDSDKIAIKFNIVELGSIIRAILYNEPFSTVHRFGDISTSISIQQYEKKNKAKAIGISISKNKNKFSISLDMNEATVLWVFCQNAILEMSESE